MHNVVGQLSASLEDRWRTPLPLSGAMAVLLVGHLGGGRTRWLVHWIVVDSSCLASLHGLVQQV